MRRLLLLLLLFPFPLLAQTGAVTGVALDSVGNVVGGATITVCPNGSPGIPCSPVTASTTSNGQGAFSVTVPIGTYTVTVFRVGIVATSSTVVVAPSNITVANNTIYTGNVTIGPGTLTVSGTGTLFNMNNIFWAGSQATPGTPTITAAETSGRANLPCRFDVSPPYNGTDSTNLFTTSMGYKVYAPSNANICFGFDNRQNTNGFNAPLYNFLIMGRQAGSLTATGTNLWSATYGNPIPDSTSASANFLWVGGSTAVSLPAAGGDQLALIGVANATDNVNPNGSPSVLSGIDGECNLNNTTQGTGTIAACWGGSFAAHITRATSVGHAAIAGAAHFFGFGNNSTSGGGADKIYTIKVEGPGTTLSGESASIYSVGNFLFDQNSSIYAHTSGSTGGPAESLRFAGTGIGVLLPLFSVTAGNTPIGLASNPFASLWLGTAATNAFVFNPLATAGSRTINIADPGATSGLLLGGTNLTFSPTAPTIAAAGCGGGAASIVIANGTAAFKVNVGTTPGSACTLTFPTATTGWNVTCNDITTQSTSVFVQKQTGAESTTSVTITNFSDVAVATAFVASDILKCTAAAD